MGIIDREFWKNTISKIRAALKWVWKRLIKISINTIGAALKWIWKRLIKILIILMLGLTIIWLMGGLILYLQNTFTLSTWQSYFILQNRPILSLGGLLILVVVFWLSFNKRWVKFFGWFKTFTKLHRNIKITIALSITFYITLIFTIRLTGHSIDNDWLIILIATVPLLTPLLLLLIESAKSIRAKFAGFEIELQRTVTTPTMDQTITLEQNALTKGTASMLPELITQYRDSPHKPRILRVQIRRRRYDGMRISFFALRDYVHGLVQVTPLEYIVFVDEFDTYLGYMPIEKFIAKYPKLSVELWLEDLAKDDSLAGLFESIIIRDTLYNSRNTQELLESVKKRIVADQWSTSSGEYTERRTNDRYIITEQNLSNLGVESIYLQSPTVFEAFQRMEQENLNGIPIVDKDAKFVGVATRERIMREVVTQLLKKD